MFHLGYCGTTRRMYLDFFCTRHHPAIQVFNYGVSCNNDCRFLLLPLFIYLANKNYEGVVKLHQERYGSKEIILNAHYSQLIDLSTAVNNKIKLRSTYDATDHPLHLLSHLVYDWTSILKDP